MDWLTIVLFRRHLLSRWALRSHKCTTFEHSSHFSTSCCKSLLTSGGGDWKLCTSNVWCCWHWGHGMKSRLDLSSWKQQQQHIRCLQGNSICSSRILPHDLHVKSSIPTPEVPSTLSVLRGVEHLYLGPAIECMCWLENVLCWCSLSDDQHFSSCVWCYR